MRARLQDGRPSAASTFECFPSAWSPAPPGPAIVRVALTSGTLELEPARRRAVSHGRELTVRGRAYELLLALAARPGRVLSARQLMSMVWPDVAVEENNLRVQVAHLRRQLGTAAILNVPRRGYALAVADPPDRRPDDPAGAGPSAEGRPAGARRQSEELDDLDIHDLPALHRLIDECLDLWLDPAAWRRHLLAGLSRLLDCSGAIQAAVEARPAGGRPVVRVLQTVGVPGAMPDIGGEPSLDRLFDGPDRSMHRSMAVGGLVCSMVRAQDDEGCDLLVLAPRRMSSRRDVALLRYAHGQLAPLVGVRLAREIDRSTHGLDPAQRRLLDLVAAGLPHPVIAGRLGLAQRTVDASVEALCHHFGVGGPLALLAYLAARRPRP